ncbi:MAG TPA: hypothetical protein VL358_14385 [Caulobacteraceae bacterium]|nr:hypothetical protein [Caulobacteraceae bacterium]
MNSIKRGAEVSDRAPDRKTPNQEAEAAKPSVPAEGADAEPAAPPDSDLRLLIEKDAEGADYVYKLIDRATGKVIAERPREQVAHLADGPEYRAGAVVNTKA